MKGNIAPNEMCAGAECIKGDFRVDGAPGAERAAESFEPKPHTHNTRGTFESLSRHLTDFSDPSRAASVVLDARSPRRISSLSKKQQQEDRKINLGNRALKLLTQRAYAN